MAETQTKSIKGQDTEKAQEKKRRLETAPVPMKALVDESIPFPGLLGVSAMEFPIERHAALLGDPRFSHSVNNTQKAGLVTELQQNYGNAYVQRVVGLIQAKKDEHLPEEEPDLAGIERRIAAEKGSGKSLEPKTRSEMEVAFKKDFSDVRIHTDATATKLAKDLDARAFTSEKDIFFREGAYQPGSEAGGRLLGHELTHAVQQSEAPVASLTRVTEPSAAAEIEANAAGQGVVQGESLSVTRQPQAVVARQEEGGAPATPTADRAAPAGAAPAAAAVAEKGEAIEEVSEAEAKATVPEDDVIKYYWAKRKGPGGRKWASGIHSQVDKIFWARFGLEEGYKLDPRKAKDKALVPQWFKVLVEVLMPVAAGPSAEVPDLKEVTFTLAKASIKARKKQEAINLILSEVKASKMPNLEKCEGKTVKYSNAVAGEGLCSCEYDPVANKALKITVEIGDAAFSSVSWLYSSMMHEYQHVNQYLTDPKGIAGNNAMAEFEAYSWEIYHAHETGVINNPEGMKDVGRRLKDQGWDKLKWYEKILNALTYFGAIKIIRDAIGDKSWTP